MRRAFVVLVVALFGLVFTSLVIAHNERHSLRPLAESYVKLVPQELGAPNVITGILLTYRAFDTLGEVAVLFMVAAGVGLVLGPSGQRRRSSPRKVVGPARPSSEIVQSGAQILAPLISIFAAYIIMNGHRSAGGGFPGRSRDRVWCLVAGARKHPIPGQSRIPQHDGVGSGCAVCSDGYRRPDICRRIPGQSHAPAWPVRRLLQCGRDSNLVGVAGCESRLRAKRHY